MKKDFETAYKELANTEVPDLWDRIEAGLSEKSAPAEAKAEESKEPAPIKKKTKVAVLMRRYSALAAAIICAVILIPTVIVMKRAGSKFMSESAVEPAFTTESAYYDEAIAEEAEGASSEMMEEASAETEAVAEAAEMERKEAAEEQEMDSTVAVAEAFPQEESASGAVKESAKTDSAMNDAVCEDAAPEDYNKQNVSELKNIVVKVKKAEEKPMEIEVEEAGVLYTAVVEKNPSGLPGEGEEIQIFIPVVSSVALVEDGTFELDLALSEREENVYTVTGYHGEVKE